MDACIQQAGNEMSWNALRDENDPPLFILAWSVVEQAQRTDHVAHAVYHSGPTWHFFDRNEAFQAQQPRPAMFGDRLQKQGQRERRQRFVPNNGKRVYLGMLCRQSDRMG